MPLQNWRNDLGNRHDQPKWDSNKVTGNGNENKDYVKVKRTLEDDRSLTRILRHLDNTYYYYT